MNINALSLRTPKDRRGMTLVEVMVAMSIGSIIMAAVMALFFYSSRSFVAVGNYVDLDNGSRTAIDQMTREIRQASAVTAFQTNTPKSLTLTITNAGACTIYSVAYSAGTIYSVRYQWDPTTAKKELFRIQGVTTNTLLTGCDAWNFTLCSRVPKPNTFNQFFPATTPDTCKLIDMNWKCSRTNYLNRLNSESVQTAQIVLRN